MKNMTAPKIIPAKVQGECGFCGTAKWVPSHRADEIRPRPEVVCGHGS